MSNKKPHEEIPDQNTGGSNDIEYSHACKDPADARALYQEAKERLLSVNNWQEYAGKGSAGFQLFDHKGEKVERKLQKGDFFQIDIPGPGSKAGDGYDWVQVEEVEEQGSADSDCLLIRVRPTQSPVNSKKDVAHFFSEEASSNFLLERKGVVLLAAVYGRNEVPNTKTDGLLDKARNFLIGGPAAAGVSKLQWKSLVKGLIGR